MTDKMMCNKSSFSHRLINW